MCKSLSSDDRKILVLQSQANMFEKIRKRDGNVVDFDSSKITATIAKAGKAIGEFGMVEAKKLTIRVLDLAHELNLGSFPDVEGVQDIVERVLFEAAFFKSAKAYILHREQHTQIRAIPDCTIERQQPEETVLR